MRTAAVKTTVYHCLFSASLCQQLICYRGFWAASWSEISKYTAWRATQVVTMLAIKIKHHNRVKDWWSWILTSCQPQCSAIKIKHRNRVKDWWNWISHQSERLAELDVATEWKPDRAGCSNRVKDWQSWMDAATEWKTDRAGCSNRVKDWQSWMQQQSERLMELDAATEWKTGRVGS